MTILKIPKERIEGAKKRLDLSFRGSDEEYYNHHLQQYKEFGHLRMLNKTPANRCPYFAPQSTKKGRGIVRYGWNNDTPSLNPGL